MLLIVVLLSTNVSAAALDLQTAAEPDIITVDTSSKETISKEEALQYAKYVPGVEGNTFESVFVRGVTAADILSYCTLTSSRTIAQFQCPDYQASFPEAFLPAHSKLKSVSSLNDIIYIYYVTADGYEVISSHSSLGLHDICIYESDTDTAIEITGSSQILYRNFRYGCYDIARDL